MVLSLRLLEITICNLVFLGHGGHEGVERRGDKFLKLHHRVGDFVKHVKLATANAFEEL